MVTAHIISQQRHLKEQLEAEAWKTNVIDLNKFQLLLYCFKVNHRRRKRQMKAWFKKNWSNVLMVAISILFLSITIAIYHEPKPSTDWLAQKQPVSPWLNISNGNESLRVHQDSMIVYTPIWNESGSLECYYILFTYNGSRITLEITDNEAGSMEEWKESIEACFPVGGSNE